MSFRSGAVFGACVAVALMAAVAMGRAQERLQLEVWLNGAQAGLIVPVEREADGALRVSKDDAAKIGLDTAGSRGGFIDLHRLPGVTAVYDPIAQTLALTTTPDALAPRVISRPRPAPERADSGLGFAVNYDLSHRQNRMSGRAGVNTTAFAFDGWLFAPPGRLGTTGLALFNEGADADWRRYETRFETEFPDVAVSMSLGDTVTSTLGAGRPIRLGGLRFSRDFTMRPDIVTVPLPAFEGQVSVPTAVDVFVDGSRVITSRDVSGRFRVEDIPVPQGAGEAVLALRGPDGRIEETTLSFFGTRGLLKAGTVDWSVEVGRPRLSFGAADSGYADETVGNGTLRYGVSDRLTLSAHGAATEGFWQASLGAVTTLANRAEITGRIGQGGDDVSTGRFVEVGGFGRLGGRFRLSAEYILADEGFTDLAATVERRVQGAAQSPLTMRTVLGFGTTADEAGRSFGLNYVRTERPDSVSEAIGLGVSARMRGGNLSFNGRHDLIHDETRLSALFSLTLGRKSVITSADSIAGASVLVTRPLRDDLRDWGYAVEASGLGDRDERVSARLSLDSGLGLAEGFVSKEPDRVTGDLRLRGALAMVNGRVAAGRTVRGGFAVVDAGRRGVDIRHQNRVVARTGLGGRALISNLNAHGRNRVSILVDDLPDDAVWTTTAEEVVPRRRAGVHVDLGVGDTTTQRLITVTSADRRALPVGSEVAIGGRAHPLGLGYDGVLYLTDAAEGAEIKITTRQGDCIAAVPPPSSDANVEVICR